MPTVTHPKPESGVGSDPMVPCRIYSVGYTTIRRRPAMKPRVLRLLRSMSESGMLLEDALLHSSAPSRGMAATRRRHNTVTCPPHRCAVRSRLAIPGYGCGTAQTQIRPLSPYKGAVSLPNWLNITATAVKTDRLLPTPMYPCSVSHQVGTYVPFYCIAQWRSVRRPVGEIYCLANEVNVEDPEVLSPRNGFFLYTY